MIEVELPDGTIIEFPEGTSPETMKRALQNLTAASGPNGMTPGQRAKAAREGTLPQPSAERLAAQRAIDQRAEDRMILDSEPAAFNFATKFLQGVPFVGEYLDEAVGAVSGPADRDFVRAVQGAMEREYPKTSTALQFAGGVAGAVPMAAAAGPSVMAAAPSTLLGQSLAAGAASAVAGGLEGAISGFGVQGDRVRNAANRGALGFALGGAVGGLAPLAATGARAALEWAKGYDARIISRVLGIDRKSAEMLKASMAADDPAKALASIQRAGDDAMLADAGKGPAQLLDTAMQSSGGAARIAGDRIEERAARAGRRIGAVFDSLLGKADDGIKSAARSISKATSDVRSKAYERAFSQPINYADDTGRAIEEVISRVPQDKLGAAVKAANDAMQIEGRVNKQIMATIAPDGSVKLTQPLDVFQLNELKVALGTQKRAAVDQFGRPTREGVLLGKLETDLRDAISNAVPGYKAALRLGADKIAEDQGLELGRKMLSPSVTREEVAEGLKDASSAAVKAVKRGLRIAIDERMANVQAVISDPNIDAREAIKMVRELSSKAARQKVTDLLGTGRANTLFDALDEAAAHLELRAAVARNSATAARTAIQDEAKRIVGDTALDAVRDGRPIEATRRIMQTLTGGSEARKAEELRALYATVADVLTKTRGKDAEEAMKVITAALEGQAIKTEDAAKVARVIAGSAALGGYQAGMQSLARPQSAPR